MGGPGMRGGGSAGPRVGMAPGGGPRFAPGSRVAGGRWVGRPGWSGRPGWGWNRRNYYPFIGGALIGSALAYPYYYDDYYYGDYYDPYYYNAPAVPVSGGSVAYCMRRFKSYDPQSGTYLGYDGQRHPCP
ncbi:MAG TPA: BA14K family protein [Xanthobacteraceae bacterium]|nr:BA14K family protein [Xanthobacteraceae bacterium]